MKYQLLKVFDCLEMPSDVRKNFFSAWDNKGNDCYLRWSVETETEPVDQWLLANGAELGEDVLISHWW